jgi:hypothetical protein
VFRTEKMPSKTQSGKLKRATSIARIICHVHKCKIVRSKKSQKSVETAKNRPEFSEKSENPVVKMPQIASKNAFAGVAGRHFRENAKKLRNHSQRSAILFSYRFRLAGPKAQLQFQKDVSSGFRQK